MSKPTGGCLTASSTYNWDKNGLGSPARRLSQARQARHTPTSRPLYDERSEGAPAGVSGNQS